MFDFQISVVTILEVIFPCKRLGFWGWGEGGGGLVGRFGLNWFFIIVDYVFACYLLFELIYKKIDEINIFGF